MRGGGVRGQRKRLGGERLEWRGMLGRRGEEKEIGEKGVEKRREMGMAGRVMEEENFFFF